MAAELHDTFRSSPALFTDAKNEAQWAAVAARGQELGLSFYQFSFVDLFGIQRAKLVPAARVVEMATNGAGFAGFAAHLDLGPYDGDLMGMPDASTLVQLPWKPEVGWLSCDLVLDGKELAHGPRNVLRAAQAKLKEAHGLTLKTGVECEFFLIDGGSAADRAEVGDARDVADKPCYEAGALMRRFDVIATLIKHMEALGWGPYQADHEDANGHTDRM